MLSTNAQVNASVLQVISTAENQKTGLTGIAEIDTRMVFNVYNSIFATENDAVNSILIPLFNTNNQSVINSTSSIEKVITPIRNLLLQVRDKACSIKRNNLVQITARIDFWTKDVSAFLNGLATTTLNKFNAKTIVISKVAACQKTAFTAFNATLAQAATNMTNCAKSFMSLSQSGYSIIQNHYAGISNVFDSVVLNVPACMTSSGIQVGSAINAATSTQRSAYVACIEPVSRACLKFIHNSFYLFNQKAVKAANTYLTGTISSTIVSGVTNKLTSDSTSFFNCIE